MAEFQEVMAQWARMCSMIDNCDKCPLMGVGCLAGSPDAMPKDLSQREDAIMEWAAENPEPVYPTWEEWLLDNGVFAPDNVLINRKYRFYMEGKPVLNIPTKKIYDRIPADIAQKLGIQPMDGGDEDE